LFGESDFQDREDLGGLALAGDGVRRYRNLGKPVDSLAKEADRIIGATDELLTRV
jgi:hypothetical protein